MLIFDVSNCFHKTITHIEYECNRSIFCPGPNLKTMITLQYGKTLSQIFDMFVCIRLIYLKSGPKVRGRWGHWDSFLTGTSFFKSSLAQPASPRVCVWRAPTWRALAFPRRRRISTSSRGGPYRLVPSPSRARALLPSRSSAARACLCDICVSISADCVLRHRRWPRQH